MQNQNIDHGNKFDWGKTSADYARFRDIYPPQFYEMILNRNCGAAGQRVLDVGTGTERRCGNCRSVYGHHESGLELHG